MPLKERCVVLVADDEPSILQIVSFSLRRHGYEVISAGDGASALKECQLHDGPIHLAVLDTMMPGMTGPELFECLKAHYKDIPVLFMSGFQPEQIPEFAHHLQDEEFICKPFLPRQIVARVNHILGNDVVCTLDDDYSVGTP